MTAALATYKKENTMSDLQLQPAAAATLEHWHQMVERKDYETLRKSRWNEGVSKVMAAICVLLDEPPTNERIDSDSPRVDLGGESELSARIDALFRVRRSPALAAQLNKIYEHHESIPRYTT